LDAWIENEIDHFILARQKEAGVFPNKAASKRILARRAYLDLLGLPPSPEEMDTFLSDSSPEAWSRLIDRLLASPHFGERQARHWMDVARFAESFGFEQNYDRPNAFYYRDFLIEAFNEDMPWDQMVRWQLAGDELVPDDRMAWMATGFLVGGVFPTQITEAEFEQSRYDEIDDMVGTTGAAFLGLSIGCARCHDHKYDPIPVHDYYEMAATFATAIRCETPLEFNAESFQTRQQSWTEKREQLAADLKGYEDAKLRGEFGKWLKQPTGLEEIAPDSAWSVLSLEKVSSRDGATFTQQPDGSWLASGKSPAFDETTVVTNVAAGASALRIEALTHDSMKRKGPGRAGNGNFALSDLKIEAKTGDGKSVPVKLVDARATHQQDKGTLSVKGSIDGNRDKTGWAVDRGGIGKDQAAIFVFEKPLEADAKLTVTMRFHLNTQHTFGRFRLAVSENPAAHFELGQGGEIHLTSATAKLKAGKSELSPKERDAVWAWFAGRDADWKKQKAALDAHLAAEPKREMKPVMVCSEGLPPMKNHADGRGYPHFYPNVHHLNRGDPKQKQEVAEPGFLRVLMPEEKSETQWKIERPAESKSSHRRSALASWMTDPEIGSGRLLARVIVNRIWQQHFGKGIVATPNDFGFQGSSPTHPELLDWLAKDLLENGWKLKRLHKQIMLSAAYRQSSDHDAADSAKDLDNDLLWRFESRRLEAEPIRDSMLAVSGQLDRTLYGPGSKSNSMKRRSIYFFIKRGHLPNPMIVFDWPEHLVSIGKRPTTTVAPQALYLMNDPEVRSYAAGLANRANGSIEAVYQIALGRHPTDAEQKTAAEFLANQKGRYANDAAGEAATMTDFCQAILASNEFLYLP
ncbi:MAG: DUF1553 domain-containing protein, partial [Verrucomicrobiales bacterium]|nr:DUF1553 domain-containing protein [Verrucomicrobiales bacterium]